MSATFGYMDRRKLLKLVLSLPFANLLERLLTGVLGSGTRAALAASELKVAKVSHLDRPWSTAAFEYFVKVKSRNLRGEAVNEEYLPGLVVRLPDDVAQKRGTGPKAKFHVVNLYCTHQRCKTAFIPDPNEIYAVSGRKPEGPALFCPCHMSIFDVTSEAQPMPGSPTKVPLWKFDFEIRGDDIVVTGINPKAAVWEPGSAGGLSSEYPVRPGERGL